MSNKPSRRTAIKNIFTGSAALAAGASLSSFSSDMKPSNPPLKGNINHSACRWCYNDIPLEQLCAAGKEIGLVGIDLVGPKDWPTLKNYNLISTMCNGAEISLAKGWNDKQYHAKLISNYTEHIDLVAKAGYTNLFCASGNRNGMDDETGLQNCAEGLKQIMAQAEKNGVIIVMELLNSKVNHKDYMCDRSAWGVELCKRIGSPNFKLLYDIYHMQIDEGDVISTIRSYNSYFGHYHTGGVPGRNEIDETQELYYPAIMKAIHATGYKGYVAQEFIPKAVDKIDSLRKAVQICDI
ncbi:MAG: TIM barrel protein [Bacteroidetes bacterium]|nr:TIM barrel protein [Bacteroidota bacterium]